MEYSDFIERVRSESDILTVVSEYVSLKKKGKYYWGCCPFHNEKTPSFSVTEEKGLFYCFGCHEGGDVFKFLQKADGLSFMEAAKKLAEKFAVPLPERERSPEEIAEEKERARLFAVNETAQRFFNACLTKTNYGIAANGYLKGRGLSNELIERFGIGFAPAAWDKLSGAFLKRGFLKEELLAAGLAVEGRGDGIYDRFRNRVMFPIADEQGRVIGFGGRVMDDGQPKYLNSPETIIFNKRNMLFALNLARRRIKEKDCVIIVEGYMDAITAHVYGITNAVASLGTAFTEQQCRRLLRYTRNLIFSYDSDAAGQNATLRALEIAKNLGANVRVLEIPDGKDPDEFLRKHGRAAFEGLIAGAMPFVDYQLQMTLKKNDNTTLEGKVGALNALLPILAAITNSAELSERLQQAAREIGLDEAMVKSEFNEWLRKNKKDNFVKRGQNITQKPLEKAVVLAGRYLIGAMWREKSLIPFMAKEMPPQKFIFVKPEHAEITGFFYDNVDRIEDMSQTEFFAALSDKAGAEASLALMEEEGIEAGGAMMNDCMRTINLEYLKHLYEKHRFAAEKLERMGDDGYLRELAESQRIKDEINKLYSKDRK